MVRLELTLGLDSHIAAVDCLDSPPNKREKRGQTLGFKQWHCC